MARTQNPEAAAIAKVGRLLETIPLEERTRVLDLVRTSSPEAARVAARIGAQIEDLTPTARQRVVTFVVGQVAEAYAREHGNGEEAGAEIQVTDGLGNRSTIQLSDGSTRSLD